MVSPHRCDFHHVGHTYLETNTHMCTSSTCLVYGFGGGHKLTPCGEMYTRMMTVSLVIIPWPIVTTVLFKGGRIYSIECSGSNMLDTLSVVGDMGRTVHSVHTMLCTFP